MIWYTEHMDLVPNVLVVVRYWYARDVPMYIKGLRAYIVWDVMKNI